MSIIRDVKHYYDELHLKFNDFLAKLKEEGVETQEAFNLVKDYSINGKILTDEEKEQVGNQLKDVFKTVGLVGLAALPGGSLFFVLFHFLKMNKYIMPSAFLDNKKNID